MHGIELPESDSKGTGQRYGLHSSASSSVHSASIIVLDLLKKKKKKKRKKKKKELHVVQNGVFDIFRLATTTL